MSGFDRVLRIADHLFPRGVANAHCDIPCGIYDPITAKIAAQTVQKMAMRMTALKPADATASDADKHKYNNTMARYVAVKEHHAEVCKKEIDILWHDYFKPEHLEKYPDLHAKVWAATKLASFNKQNVDVESAKKLVAAVDEIATIFWESKGQKYNDQLSAVRFGS
ncbi:MAG: superoxide dismutase, Ni [SAR202 cluster bacterium]|nr:superoxide dismutase, Ni [SAR202 cluster bacterium]